MLFSVHEWERMIFTVHEWEQMVLTVHEWEATILYVICTFLITFENIWKFW